MYRWPRWGFMGLIHKHQSPRPSHLLNVPALYQAVQHAVHLTLGFERQGDPDFIVGRGFPALYPPRHVVQNGLLPMS